MKSKSRILVFLLLLVSICTSLAQDAENDSKSLYLGIEPFSFALGYKGGFVDYKVNCNEQSSGIHFYPSIRFGVQIGFKIF